MDLDWDKVCALPSPLRPFPVLYSLLLEAGPKSVQVSDSINFDGTPAGSRDTGKARFCAFFSPKTHPMAVMLSPYCVKRIFKANFVEFSLRLHRTIGSKFLYSELS